MKKSLVLAMAMALGVTASAYAANPFSDVPAGHWAYDSVAKLAAAGVVDGYADGAFDGDKLMTRYEMAQIVAKAMAKGANVDKLAAEFADELDTLGVRVAKLEKGADAVKITGEVRYHYAEHDGDVKNGNEDKMRSRIWFTGAVNDDWTYTGMIEHNNDLDDDAATEDVKFQRAYLDGKLGGLKVRAGRYNLQLGQKAVNDHRFDGVQATYGKDVKLMVGAGKQTAKSYDHVVYSELSGKVGVIDLMAGYYDFQDASEWSEKAVVKENQDNFEVDLENGTFKPIDTEVVDGAQKDKKIWAVGAAMPVAKNLKLSAIYLDGDMKGAVEDKGFQASLAYKGAKASVPGSWGLEAFWYDLGDATYVDHTMNAPEGDFLKLGGFEGYSVQAAYTLAKNIVAKVEWYDLEAQDNSGKENETLWGQVVFTF
ncbi:MAG: S-layer homology domain-containing protein [Phascolarctobacterium sp.]|nr:S-layer homology domain-containing protein [Phascolarctobacterium sp.]